MDFYKTIAIASPFISALLAGLVAYYFTLKTKRFDLLYQSKLPAFKEIASELVAFKKFCEGRVAYLQGNEFSPYYEENKGTLHYRTKIANRTDSHAIFLSNKSRNALETLVNQMSMLCNAEIQKPELAFEDIAHEYIRMSAMAEICIELLYKELNLRKV